MNNNLDKYYSHAVITDKLDIVCNYLAALKCYINILCYVHDYDYYIIIFIYTYYNATVKQFKQITKCIL